MNKKRGDSLLNWTIVLAVASASFLLMRNVFKDALRHKIEAVSVYMLWNGTNYTPPENDVAVSALSRAHQSQTVKQVEVKDPAVAAKIYDHTNVAMDERSASVSAEDGAEDVVKGIDISTIVP